MKAIFLLTVPAYFAFLSISNANEYAERKMHGDKYCAKLQDGRMVVMHDGAVLNADVTLSNGTQVKTDGTVIYKDGTRSMLREGECVNKDGKPDSKKNGNDRDMRKQQ
jgi:hypothetical protein